MKVAFLVGALLLPAVAAQAKEIPGLVPTRDVDVVYRVKSPEHGRQRFRVRWQSSTKLERIDDADGTITLIDRPRDQLEVLTPSLKTFIVVDASANHLYEKHLFFPKMGASPEQGQDARVAGHACTEWHWDASGDTHTLCATDDGVVLRFSEGVNLEVKAVRLHYRKSDPELFLVPDDYEQVTSFSSDSDSD